MKKQFLESKFGKELVSMITEWDQALEKNSRSGEDKDILRTLAWWQAQWEVDRMAIKHFYGVEYHFSRTDEYYGLCTEDESDWLMKVDRKLVMSLRCEITEDVADALMRAWENGGKLNILEQPEKCTINDRKRNREALRKALQETMEIVLESELFTNAAKRGIEDYEHVVSCNIPMMTDLVLSIYENILFEVRD